jgi:hypothetical protein
MFLLLLLVEGIGRVSGGIDVEEEGGVEGIEGLEYRLLLLLCVGRCRETSTIGGAVMPTPVPQLLDSGVLVFVLVLLLIILVLAVLIVVVVEVELVVWKLEGIYDDDDDVLRVTPAVSLGLSPLHWIGCTSLLLFGTIWWMWGRYPIG